MEPTRNLDTLPPAKAWIIVHGGPNDNAMLRLRRKDLTIGHDPNKADLVLDDKSISGEHLRIKPDGDHYIVADLASRNGTMVNGQTIRQVYLNDGDVIRIGHTVLVYKYIAAHTGRA